jgi:hypothetical protein
MPYLFLSLEKGHEVDHVGIAAGLGHSDLVAQDGLKFYLARGFYFSQSSVFFLDP